MGVDYVDLHVAQEGCQPVHRAWNFPSSSAVQYMDDCVRSIQRVRDVALLRAHTDGHLILIRVSPPDYRLDEIVAINDICELQYSNHSRCPKVRKVENGERTESS